jgi:crotonobetainyl-CoA:carnitine CoA-transferase CaiB-like acyl-CoA transferase
LAPVLSGVRVLDFGRFIAAPWCAAILGDMGADVIRIERRGGAEDRSFSPVSATGDGSLFLQCNRNKSSLTLDPMKPEGKEIVRRLVAQADIVIANLPEAGLNALGLDYESLRSVKPDIILTSCTAYGVGGPYSNRVGYDGIGQVMSGAVYRSGTPEQPMRCAASYVDFCTAMTLSTATLAALLHRQTTGLGQHVEGSLLATALMMTNPMVIEQAVIKSDRIAMGNRGPGAAPTDLYRTRDGWVLMQVVGDPMFKRWCHMVAETAWLEDPRFKSDELRGRNGAVLNDRMQQWCAELTSAQLLAALEAARLPGAALMTPQDVLDDPHIAKMGFLRELDYPGLPRPAPVMETPFRMSLTPGTIRQRAPLAGEHTDQILHSLGYTQEAIVSLRAAGVI